MGRAQILVVDDRANLLSLLERILGESHQVTRAEDGQRAISLVASREFDVVLTDLRMPGADGFEVLRVVKARAPDTEVILMTANATVPDAVSAMKQGAFDYLPKPFDPDEASLVVARALERRRLRARARPPEGAMPGALLVELPYREVVDLARDRVSRDYLVVLLMEFKGHVTLAAERAGMERESLHRLLKRYGVKADDFKERGSAPEPVVEAPR